MRAALVLGTFVLFLGTTVGAWEQKPTAALSDDEVKDIRVEGDIDIDTLRAVRAAIAEVTKKDSKVKVLRVSLMSPGGAAIPGLTAALELRRLSDAGRVKVETRAAGLCASACTFLLAAGTPGYRYVDHYTLILVHPAQNRGGCMEHKDEAQEANEKIANALLELGRDLYMKFTGQPKAEVERWLSCGYEQAGLGELAVALKLADKVEE